MLPETLTGSYRRYKEDTSSFVTWLDKTAISCGYKSPTTRYATVEDEDVAGGTPPGSASTTREPSSTLKYAMPTKEIINQARAIAEYTVSPVKIPAHVQSLLKQAIQARKRCAAWFSRVSSDGASADVVQSNKAHEHFIAVLEIVHDILRPGFEVFESASCSSSTPTSKNRYETLDVEDINDEAPPSIPSVAANVPVNISSAKSKDTEHEIDLAFESELQFIVYCAYEDLHMLEDFLDKTWMEVNEGTLDARTAAITTNLAIALVRKTEDSIVALSQERFAKDSYRSITSAIYSVPTFDAPDPDPDSTPSGLPLGSRVEYFVYQPTFQLLEKFSRYSILTDGALAVIPVEILYVIQPELTPTTDEWMKDDILLSTMLLDLKFKFLLDRKKYAAAKARAAGWLPKLTDSCRSAEPFVDEITAALDKVHRGKDVSIADVFCAKIVLNVHKHLQIKVSDVYKQLRLQGAIADKVLGIEWSWDNGLVSSENELRTKWANETVTADAISVSHSIKTIIKENSMIATKQAFLAGRSEVPGPRSLSIESSYQDGTSSFPFLTVSKSPSFFYAHNPIYSGVESLKLSIGLEKTGVAAANAFCSVSAVAHLYNAIRQKNMVKGRWKTLDVVIEANIGKLFKGSLPITAEQISNRFHLCLKIPAAALVKTYRGENANFQKPSSRSTEDVFSVQDVSACVLRYLEGEDGAERMIHTLDKISGNKSAPSQTRMVDVRLLERTKYCIQKSLSTIDLDLITVTGQCNALLQRIRQAFRSELGIKHQFGGFDISEIEPKSNSFLVNEIFHDAFFRDIVESRVPGGKGNKFKSNLLDSTPEGGKMLVIAAEVLKDFLAEVDVPITAEPFNVNSTTLRPAEFKPSRKQMDLCRKIMTNPEWFFEG